MKPHYLTPFFAPQSIAIVGASDHPHSVGGQVLSNLKASGFRGTLYPVHLVNEQVQGLTAYPTLEAIGQPVDLVMRGQIKNAFCGVRPPGHHAEHDRPMGFCFFNNIAVGAAHAMEQYGLERIAILDFDVHHGNGTEDIFKNDERILFCSKFQHPFYPYQGADTVSDHIINIPLGAGSGGAEFREAIATHCLPAFDAFQPQLVMISAGFDAHREDPLAHLCLVEADYAWVTAEMVALAERHCEGRVVSTLEGGYNTDALGRSVTEHLRVLMGL